MIMVQDTSFMGEGTTTGDKRPMRIWSGHRTMMSCCAEAEGDPAHVHHATDDLTGWLQEITPAA